MRLQRRRLTSTASPPTSPQRARRRRCYRVRAFPLPRCSRPSALATTSSSSGPQTAPPHSGGEAISGLATFPIKEAGSDLGRADPHFARLAPRLTLALFLRNRERSERSSCGGALRGCEKLGDCEADAVRHGGDHAVAERGDAVFVVHGSSPSRSVHPCGKPMNHSQNLGWRVRPVVHDSAPSVSAAPRFGLSLRCCPWMPRLWSEEISVGSLPSAASPGSVGDFTPRRRPYVERFAVSVGNSSPEAARVWSDGRTVAPSLPAPPPRQSPYGVAVSVGNNKRALSLVPRPHFSGRQRQCNGCKTERGKVRPHSGHPRSVSVSAVLDDDDGGADDSDDAPVFSPEGRADVVEPGALARRGHTGAGEAAADDVNDRPDACGRERFNVVMSRNLGPMPLKHAATEWINLYLEHNARSESDFEAEFKATDPREQRSDCRGRDGAEGRGHTRSTVWMPTVASRRRPI